MDSNTSIDYIDQLEKLNKLKEKGLLTEEEYSAEKELVLRHISENPEKIRKDYVWCLAFAPLIGEFLQQMIAEITGTASADLFYVTIVLNIFLSYLDSKEVHKAGFKGKLLDESWIIPAYLYERARILKQSPTYLWVWIVCLIVSCLA